MQKFEVRTVDLLDRMNWDDPDFPAAVRMLASISREANVYVGKRPEKIHVMVLQGKAELPVVSGSGYQAS